MKKIVIIGGVAGGAGAAARLRRLDKDAEIVVLERGPYISYANCGLPYYVGDVIQSQDALFLETPEAMKAKFNVDVRVENEVIKIDRESKNVLVKSVTSGVEYYESYDKLIISTGSSPLRPGIPGIENEKIKTLWTVPDTFSIKNLLDGVRVKNAVVIGGGFIGLEMAENLKHAGLNVHLVEGTNQVMAPVDFEMAQLLHENIVQNGVDLQLGSTVSKFEDLGGKVSVVLESGEKIDTDLVILSIGVRPNSHLAKDAGLDLNERGGIIVDEHLLTNDPDIYAVGDVIEVNDFVLNQKTMIPLAGPANKQARIVANNICGKNETYQATMGTSIAQVFDLSVASTGANEKALLKKGLVECKDFKKIYVTQNSHAGYYPGATPLTIKLLFSVDGKKIYGAQIVGMDGVDKRIDTIATTMRLNGSIFDLKTLELAYAPPYSSAKDPVNMSGFTAENTINGLVEFTDWDIENKNKGAVLLDVREPAELMAFEIPNSVNIPLGTLRNRLSELDKDKEIITFCAIGVRSYNASRILMQNGFKNVKLYPGGSRFYQSTHYDKLNISSSPESFSDSGNVVSSKEKNFNVINHSNDSTVKTIKLNCMGMQCPGPLMQVFEAMNTVNYGDILEIQASDPGFVKDIKAWSNRTGNTLISAGKDGNKYVAVLKKGDKEVKSTPKLAPTNTPDGKTMIVFSGDFDKVLASFIIANGAAAMGRPVTMFFTFWGLSALRKQNPPAVKKTFMEKMFGFMLPKGSSKLGLSKMNMGGMGTAMMKKIMKDKNVNSLEDLIQSAMKNGVKIMACTMSMDVMGITKEELIDGIEYVGVGSYLGDAEESNVNLFI